MNKYFFLFLLMSSFSVVSQEGQNPLTHKPENEIENIWVKKINEDEFQSVFVIWVRENVRMHYHQEHTENIVVLSGKAEMSLGDKKLIIRKGDHITIPKGTPHSVNKVFGKTLKVLSIQSPIFDGKDRIFVNDESDY